MALLSALSWELPLRNPVIIFSLVLFIILFAPILFNKIKVPHIIGLIIAGVIVGPYAFNLLRRDASIVLFGTVGLLYIMFLAGLEIDLSEFKKNRKKILVFGLATFLLPLITGIFASYYFLGYSFVSSLLLASMFSTHTLISYPIASRYGVVKNRAVSMTVGGTMVTDILALLILAGVAGMSKEEVSSSFWVTLGISSIVFVCIIFFALPPVIRWFFKRFDDAVSQYIFILAIVFLSAFLAEAAGLEGIIGAFFSGLVLNKFVPHTSLLMSRIAFVGNALFIPFFLISVGMLVDVTVLAKGFGAIKVAVVITMVAIVTKYVAAVVTRKIFGLSANEGLMIFGLSSSHAAATLAIILVGYNIIIGEAENGEPIRLLNEDVLNGTILLILVSCAISSFAVQRAARRMAIEEEKNEDPQGDAEHRVLISLADAENVNELVDLGLMLKPAKSSLPAYVVHVIDDELSKTSSLTAGRKMLEKAVQHAAASGKLLEPITRYDANITNGIVYTIKEKRITDVVIGLHRHFEEKQVLGNITDRLIKRCYENVYVYKPVQPFNTLKRLLIAVTPGAELEPGFYDWYTKLMVLAKHAGLSLIFYTNTDTQKALKHHLHIQQVELIVQFSTFNNWEDFLVLSGELKQDDLFVVISSRKNSISYSAVLDRLPYYLGNYFLMHGFLLIYPRQLEQGIKMDNVQHTDPTLADSLADISGMFKQKSNSADES